MTLNQTLRQTNAFAMLDGLWLGLYWSFGLLCLLKGLTNTTLGMLSLMVAISVPVLGGWFAHRFEKSVRPDGRVTYLKALLYSLFLYLYAAIILAIVTFIYFNWFDNGSFANTYIMMLHSPDMEAVLSSSETQQSLGIGKDFVKNLEEVVRQLTPIDYTSACFDTAIFFGIVLSFPTAIFGRSRQ